MNRLPSRLALCGLLLLVVAGCTLPRNAAVQSEILATQDDPDRDLQVVSVTKGNLDMVATWPATGGAANPGWITGGGRGPDTSVINPGDILSLSIWDSGENSLIASPGQKSVQILDLKVSQTGSVFIPYLGNVVVKGQTHDEAREMLQDQLAAILPSVQVLLGVVQGRRNSVDVVGGVAKVGSYPLPDRNFTMTSLLALSGGVSTSLRNPQVRLVRGGKTYGISVDRLFADLGNDTVLQGGDTVLVDNDRRYFLSLGAAGEQAQQYFDQDTITALDAVTMIGGLVDSEANPKGVLILREYATRAVRTDGRGPDRSRVVFTLDLTTADGLFSARKFQIQPKDLVLVTGSPVKNLRTVLGLFSQSISVARQIQ